MTWEEPPNLEYRMRSAVTLRHSASATPFQVRLKYYLSTCDRPQELVTGIYRAWCARNGRPDPSQVSKTECENFLRQELVPWIQDTYEKDHEIIDVECDEHQPTEVEIRELATHTMEEWDKPEHEGDGETHVFVEIRYWHGDYSAKRCIPLSREHPVHLSHLRLLERTHLSTPFGYRQVGVHELKRTGKPWPDYMLRHVEMREKLERVLDVLGRRESAALWPERFGRGAEGGDGK